MAGRADFHVDVLAGGGTGLELVAAAAGDVHFLVVRVDSGFHVVSFGLARMVTAS